MTTSTLPTHDLTKIAEHITDAIERGHIINKQELLRYKKELTRAYALPRIPSDSELLSCIEEARKTERVMSLLQRKVVRTLSGVAVVAVMTSPHPCPHGRCTPCPGGPPHTPQSYTGREPAALRAARHGFDAFRQVESRLRQLEAIGHPTDKIDLIVMGGTVPARDEAYQRFFVKRCYDAMNGTPSFSLEEAQRKNERSAHRCTGLTMETRPDWCRMQHIDIMLSLGVTRIELGVQILDDRILALMRRGHTVSDTILATRLAKDAGFKVCYHIMPGLPGSSFKNDLYSFRRMFTDERFRPDMLKLYPTLVVESSLLYREWKEGNYTPLEVDEAVELIATMKRYIPEWVRVQRVERDIPSTMIEGGITKSNLRQLIFARMKEEGFSCRCIRCREAGHLSRIHRMRMDNDFELKRREYLASGGREVFISLENEDAIVAYCRLRIPFKSHRSEMEGAAVVRELRVHGSMVAIGRRKKGAWQHRGYGRTLLHQAENISLQFGKEKILVLSGVGAREYYRKIGYAREGPYMAKMLAE